MEALIKLPSYEWFIGFMNLGGKGNTYTGSYGTQPYKGCLCGDEFRYRVWIDKDENDEKALNALYYIGNKCFGETEKEKLHTQKFEASIKGIEQAQIWLLDELERFIKTGSEQ